MRQQRWNKYEAMILLDGLLKVLDGKALRNEVIKQVSHDLRQMAINQKETIDDVYRNEAGISFQMWYMESAYTGQIKSRPAPKLFSEVIDLYRSDREAYEEMLREAKQMANAIPTVEDSFMTYLTSQVTPAKLTETYLCYPEIDAFCQKIGILKKPLFETTNLKTVKRVQETIEQNKVFQNTHGRQHKKFITAIQYYSNFIRDVYYPQLNQSSESVSLIEESVSSSANASPSEFTSPDSSEVYVVDFAGENDIAYTGPLQFSYFDVVKGNFSSWKELYVTFVSVLCSDYPYKFYSGMTFSQSGGRVDLSKYKSEPMISSVPISGTDYILETNLSALQMITKMKYILDICDVDYENVVITYRKKDSAHQLSRKLKPEQWEPKFSTQVMQIMENHYSYGFRVGSPIDRMRFRDFAEQDQISIPDLDEELDKEIDAVGTLIDGKIHVFGENVLSGLRDCVNNLLISGVKVLFYDSFMEKNEEWLEEQFIISVEMLKTALIKLFPNFYFAKNFFAPGEKKSEREAITMEIHRVIGGQDVFFSSDICTQLPYIPSNKILWTLSASNDFVWISEGKYFAMEHFIISKEAAQDIQKFVENQCRQKGYASMADLPYGDVAEQNYELSPSGLYSAIYISVLKRQYKLNGKILTRGSEVDILILLREYCQEREVCTITEVMEKHQELVGTKNRQLSFKVLYDTKIRIDKEHFVSDEQVCFDIEKIDCLLEDLIGDRFEPIKIVTTFAMFPSCGQSWNHYLLESFCYRFSKKYRLYVNHFNNKNAGVISEQSLGMSYANMLSEAAAKADIVLTSEAVGRYFFENGFTARSVFQNLPEIIERASKLRGRS